MKICGNQIMLGNPNDESYEYERESSKIYLYSTDEWKRLYNNLGISGDVPAFDVVGNTYAFWPTAIIRFEKNNDASKLKSSTGNWLWRDNGWTDGKGYVSIVYPLKIDDGIYSKMYMEVQINGLYTNPTMKMGLGANLAFDSSHSFFVMDIVSKTVADSTTATGTFFTAELDISSVSNPFYFGMYSNDVSWSIKYFWIE